MSDAFERLKNRTRPTVPSRDNSLTNNKNDEITEFSHSVNVNGLQDPIGQPVQGEEVQMPEVVRRTVRLEWDVDESLEQLCRKEKITRELFLEAAYVVISKNQSAMQEALIEARERYQRRKLAGERRKFKTMEKKLRGT